ncbi:hypothetical protein ciss_13330 [Carboxydothermus islandicus]|uniref:SHOCT domain-containing protein n=1 Tax=Carboxydothermus islandicus TaxID=661089 RepID=A0A1L8D2K2_9THEO|nr:SHOCT domain-containing protein [Carboxydothermus islandicus]GAV25400.1 hypothetical protein ciss_13330 [Carboxydothermus islandicus]
MMFFIFLFGAVIVYFIYKNYKNLTGNDILSKVVSGKTHEEILKERYARGEISKETYEEMLNDLCK